MANEKRHICVACGKKRYEKNMVHAGTHRGEYFQKGKTIENYICNDCNPENINRRLSYKMQRPV